MVQKPFDPLDMGVTPESKGFGKRTCKLSADLLKIEFLKPLNHSSHIS